MLSPPHPWRPCNPKSSDYPPPKAKEEGDEEEARKEKEKEEQRMLEIESIMTTQYEVNHSLPSDVEISDACHSCR